MPIVPVGTGRVPTTPNERAPEWISFADAITIIGTAIGSAPELSDDRYWPGDPGDDERTTVFEAAALLRNALSRGELSAYGDLGGGSHNALAAIEWAARDVSTCEGEWINAPYIRFMVSRSRVAELWPMIEKSVSLTRNRRGAPPEFDWEAIRLLDDGTLSIDKLADVLVAECEQRKLCNAKGRPPSISSLKRNIRRWRGS